MSKKFEIACTIYITFCVVATVGAFCAIQAGAAEPQTSGKYYVQVPHVVLPETIQYKHYTDNRGYEVNAGASQHPATYTAFPSYSVPDGTEFRAINQLYYPVSPTATIPQTLETVAQVRADNQIIPTEQQIARNHNPETKLPQELDANASGFADLTNVPKFEMPSSASVAQQDDEPVYLTKINTTPNPIRQVSDASISETADESESAASSIVFLKSQRTALMDDDSSDNFAPLRLSQDTSRQSNWLNRESLFVRPVTYTEVAPTQLGYMQPGAGFQQTQAAPAYSNLYQQNYNYGQQPNLYAASAPNPNYTAATGLNGVWNAYMGAAAPQQMPAQAQQYQSLTQLGGMMPVMSGQPAQMPGYGMPQQMQPAATQQTIGYILLYPQAAQSGVNMQLAGQQGQGTDGASTNDEAATGDNADPNTPNANAMQLQATFIPAQQMPNYPGMSGQPGQFPMPQMQMPNPMAGGMNPYMMNPMMMGGMNPYMMNPMMMGGMNPYMMNPMMMGGMNPYMMNPMMMGGMNPYMMNPMMMGMGGMMPPIIIQMPADSGRRRGGGGLFARMRAARQESQNSYQQASNSLSSLFGQPNQMPAKASYPYGYFGATASPYQSGSFGGYHDMSTQTAHYPGM